MRIPLLVLGLVVGLSGCAYVGTMTREAYYSARQGVAPRQRVYKHMVERDTYFVFGRLRRSPVPAEGVLAVVARSGTGWGGEIVDVHHGGRGDSYYGLNLPAGAYRLLVVYDRNGDGFYDEREVVGERTVTLSREEAPDKVLGDCDLDLAAGVASGVLERAPMLFYALEEDAGYKVPVVFVHGINGSARDFAAIVARLDRSRYQPWFFDYPSGADLSQLGEMFYRIFLSGQVIPRQEIPMVIVAHSLGGLVVREAFNRCHGGDRENLVRCLVTIASPLGGHPAAGNAAHAPVTLPSWRDLDSGGRFVRGLHRRPLPPGLVYHLYYTYGDDRLVRLGANSDGVVPLSSQLAPAAQNEAAGQFGFDDTHTGVLRNPEAVARVVGAIETVRSTFPEDHLREFDKGGFPVEAGPDFAPLEAFLLRRYGHWMAALAAGRIQPCHPEQVKFVEACRGRARPTSPAAAAWLKFVRLHPELRASG